jgi:hypothetical protein
MFRSAVVVALLFWGMVSPTVAAETGRYQAVPLSKSANEFGDRIMILDTATGELWQWWDAPALGNHPGRTGITYMGKVEPSVAPGETVSFEKRFEKPK